MNTIIRGGRLLDIARHAAEPADILVEGDTVREIGPPGMAAPPDAAPLDASGRLLMPGLVNAHTHGHNNLAKSVGDRWTLELLLNAAPWITGGRTLEDKYLSTLIGAVEMVRKGCTAAYDLSFEFPAPTAEGLEAVGRAYADAGMRAVVAPMMADRTFHRAIPGLLDALPPDARREAEAVSLEPFEASMAAWEQASSTWPFSDDEVRLALAPTIPHHCSEAFLRAANRASDEHGVGFHTHLAESKVQALAGIRLYGMTQTAWLESLGVLGPRFAAAHAVWLDRDDMRRLAAAGAAVAHNPGSNARDSGTASPPPAPCSTRACGSGSAPTPAPAPTTSTCSRRCGSRPWSRGSRSLTTNAGSRPARFSTWPPEGVPGCSDSTTPSGRSSPAGRPTSCSSTSPT